MNECDKQCSRILSNQRIQKSSIWEKAELTESCVKHVTAAHWCVFSVSFSDSCREFGRWKVNNLAVERRDFLSSPLPLTPEFIRNIRLLGRRPTTQMITDNLIRKYGTHFLLSATLGGKTQQIWPADLAIKPYIIKPAPNGGFQFVYEDIVSNHKLTTLTQQVFPIFSSEEEIKVICEIKLLDFRWRGIKE